jgi:hypothetical protein
VCRHWKAALECPAALQLWQELVVDFGHELVTGERPASGGQRVKALSAFASVLVAGRSKHCRLMGECFPVTPQLSLLSIFRRACARGLERRAADRRRVSAGVCRSAPALLPAGGVCAGAAPGAAAPGADQQRGLLGRGRGICAAGQQAWWGTRWGGGGEGDARTLGAS